MKTFHKVVLNFNQLLAQHQFLEALDYYHEEVISADNLQPAIKGLAALRQKTQEFVENASIVAQANIICVRPERVTGLVSVAHLPNMSLYRNVSCIEFLKVSLLILLH